MFDDEFGGNVDAPDELEEFVDSEESSDVVLLPVLWESVDDVPVFDC